MIKNMTFLEFHNTFKEYRVYSKKGTRIWLFELFWACKSIAEIKENFKLELK